MKNLKVRAGQVSLSPSSFLLSILPLFLPTKLHPLLIIKLCAQVFHIPFTTINTNPSVWGPDASAFNPARWITPGGMPPPSELPHGWSGLLTFCDGPRNCIGWRLGAFSPPSHVVLKAIADELTAVFEFKVILATLIRSLEFRDTGAVVQQKISPTLQPVVDGKGGLLPLYIKLA